ncbi:MAG: hypothetical protein GF397_01535 [Elusimicrobia bacterium]|nr:hypothetical protein [Elusimicrobiota bacterium]
MGGDTGLKGVEYGKHQLIDTHSIHVQSMGKHIKDPEVIKAHARDMHVLYCAFYGAGRKSAPRIMRDLKAGSIETIEQMQKLDGTFPGLKVPDPALVPSWKVALKMFVNARGEEALAQKTICLSNDPDADRFGLVIRVPAVEIPQDQDLAEAMGIAWTLSPELQKKYGFGGFRVVQPNEWGSLITWYDLMKREQKDGGKIKNPKDLSIAYTHVTTDALGKLAEKYGIGTKLLPVGVDQIAEYIEKQEEKEEEVISGIEESGTYATSDHILDKDGFLAGVRMFEIACYAQSQGTTLSQLFNNLSLDSAIGCFASGNFPMQFEVSISGYSKRTNIMRFLHKKLMPYMKEKAQNNDPCIVADMKVLDVDDQDEFRQKKYDEKLKYPGFPDAGIRFYFDDNKMNHITIRPSGTEPKIRFYVQLYDPTVSQETLNQKKQMLYTEIVKIAKAWMYIAQINELCPVMERSIQEFKDNSGLPLVCPQKKEGPEALTQWLLNFSSFEEAWTAFYSELLFDRPIYRRVEREKDGEERKTGVPAFKVVDSDTDIVDLMEYDASAWKGIIRSGDAMVPVLEDPDAQTTAVAYYMYRGIFASRQDIRKAFYDNKIRYDVTILMPALWGREHVKTYGHFHDPVEMPEIYQVLSGEAVYIMQKCDEDGSVIDVVTVHAQAGDFVIMLPGYGHVSVNASTEKPLVMANWLTWHQTSDYIPYKDHKGAACYIIRDDKGRLRAIPNSNYTSLPAIRQMSPSQTLKHFGLQSGKSIYTLVKDPQFSVWMRHLIKPEEYIELLQPETTLDAAVSSDMFILGTEITAQARVAPNRNDTSVDSAQ